MLGRARRAGWLLALAASGLLVLGGCVGGKSTPAGTGPSSVIQEGDGPPSNSKGPELPVLVEIKSNAGETYTRVLLKFEPGTEEPRVELTEYDKSAVPKPGSGEPVDLKGKQALKAVVSPAKIDKVNVAAVRRDDPAVAEVIVLGSSGDRVGIGIGVQGEGELRPRKMRRGDDTIVISLRNPSSME